MRTFDNLESFEEINGVQIGYGEFYEIGLGSKVICVTLDQADPCRYGITNREHFRTWVSRAFQSIDWFRIRKGWAARPTGSSAWSKLYRTRHGAITGGRQMQREQRHTPAQDKAFGEALGLPS